jgi:hypothetical protein
MGLSLKGDHKTLASVQKYGKICAGIGDDRDISPKALTASPD